MLLDRPARFLYRHDRDLYVPMVAFAAEYRWLLRALVITGTLIAALLLGRP